MKAQFAIWLRETADQRTLSAHTIAQRLNLPAQLVQSWMVGVTLPDGDQAQELAAVLGVSVRDLRARLRGPP